MCHSKTMRYIWILALAIGCQELADNVSRETSEQRQIEQVFEPVDEIQKVDAPMEIEEPEVSCIYWPVVIREMYKAYWDENHNIHITDLRVETINNGTTLEEIKSMFESAGYSYEVVQNYFDPNEPFDYNAYSVRRPVDADFLITQDFMICNTVDESDPHNTDVYGCSDDEGYIIVPYYNDLFEDAMCSANQQS